MTMSILSKLARSAGVLAIVTGAAAVAPERAEAQERFIGEVTPYAFGFCPRGSTLANGALLPIAQNTALFALYGTNFGGDGRTTFGLPNLNGRAVMGLGNVPGLTTRQLGQAGGATTAALNAAQMPSHNHAMRAVNGTANTVTTQGTVPATVSDPSGLPINLYSITAPTVNMSGDMITATGGGQPHANEMPYLAIYWCVALTGIFPSRS